MDNQNDKPSQTPAGTNQPVIPESAGAAQATSVPEASGTPTYAPIQQPSPAVSVQEAKSLPTYILFLIGATVIVIVIIGLVIFLGNNKINPPLVPTQPATSPTAGAVQPTQAAASESAVPTLSSSDEVSALEKDTNTTNTDNLNQEDADITKELQGL